MKNVIISQLIRWYLNFEINYVLHLKSQNRKLFRFQRSVINKIINKKILIIRKKIKNISSIYNLNNIIININNLYTKKFLNENLFLNNNINFNILFILDSYYRNNIKYKLLNKILSNIFFDKKKFYKINIIFFKIPYNRNNNIIEIEFFKPFIEKYIGLINPKLIILLGKFAVNNFINIKNNIFLNENNIFFYKNIYINNIIKTFKIFNFFYLFRYDYKKKYIFFYILKIKNYLNNF